MLSLEYGWSHLPIDNSFCLSSSGVWHTTGCEVTLHWLLPCLVPSLIFFSCWLTTLFPERKLSEPKLSVWTELEVLALSYGWCSKSRLSSSSLSCVGENWPSWTSVCGSSRWSLVSGFDLLLPTGLLTYRFPGGFCKKKSHSDSIKFC